MASDCQNKQFLAIIKSILRKKGQNVNEKWLFQLQIELQVQPP
jgi:hypothetical protein